MSAIETQLEHAWTLFKARRYAEAAEMLSAVIAIDVTIPAAYSKRARCYHRMEDHGQALSDISRAIELSPKTAAYHFTRGRYYFEVGQFHEACDDFSNVVNLESGLENKPFLEAALFFRAEANFKRKRFEEAFRDCSEIKEDFGLYVLGRMRTRNEIVRDVTAGLKESKPEQ